MHPNDGILNGSLSPCGHRNPQTSYFCDVCGVRLPVPCPRCHTVNRSEANFCSMCGIDLRVVRTEPLPAPRETSGPATHPETDDKSAPESVDRLSWTPESGNIPVEDEPGDTARLERMSRFLHRRRRVWAWLPHRERRSHGRSSLRSPDPYPPSDAERRRASTRRPLADQHPGKEPARTTQEWAPRGPSRGRAAPSRGGDVAGHHVGPPSGGR